VQNSGFKVCFFGGYVTGAALGISEPLLAMTEQVGLASAVANAIDVPLIADAGAGWGDALHTMRTVREFCKSGVAGVHIEDQIFPKRAHYHKYVAHLIPIEEYVEKIQYACRERDRIDRNFLISRALIPVISSASRKQRSALTPLPRSAPIWA
jgi:2-methylisocitrate lyase-like PEP mutase family enzyme